MSKQETIDKLDILSIEEVCSRIIGCDVRVLWKVYDDVLRLDLSWGKYKSSCWFRHDEIAQSNLSLTDMVALRLQDQSPTCTDITDKCCNQFGERDEIQTIINSLQADVVARGNRIAELEDLLAEITFMLQSDVSTKVADVLTMLLGDVDD